MRVAVGDRLKQPSDADAWSRFAGLYTPLIYAWARSVGLQDQDASDLVSRSMKMWLNR